MITPALLHYIAAGIGISLGAIGAGIGLGIAGSGVQGAMTRQPTGNMQSFRAMIIGLALIESGAIIALVTTLMTLFGGVEGITWNIARAELGIGLAVGVAAAAISIASSSVVKATTQAIARQPFFAPKILTFMLISQSIIEAPAIFAFVVGMLIKTQLFPALDFYQSLKLFASGLVVAIGCIGPSIGQSLFAYAACTSIGVNKNAYNKIFPFSLLNEAIIETPMIFCVLFALLIMYTPLNPEIAFYASLKAFVAALTVGIAALVSSTGMGYVASRSCYQIALEPSVYAILLRSNLLAVAFIESSMIYAVIIGIFLIL